MLLSAKESGADTRKLRLWHVGSALLVAAFLGGLYACNIVRVSPPFIAVAEDAITHKAVPGMNVCLHIESIGREVLSTKMSRTGVLGILFLPPSIQAGPPLLGFDRFWVRVTDPDAGMVSPCGSDIGPNQTRANGWPIQLGADAHGRTRYFPVALLRGVPDPYFLHWGAMHRSMGFPVGSRIALIPVLQSPSDCKQIQDPSLAEDCRQLNTFAAAMSLRKRDDKESWARAEALCDEVDHSTYSATCKGVFRRVTMSRQMRQQNPNYDAAHDPFDDPNYDYGDLLTVRQPPPTGPPPEIDSVTPETGVPGVTDITIRGRHFGETQGNSTVSVGNRNGIVGRWTDTEIVATVDEHAHRGKVSVWRERQHSNAIPFTPVGLFIDAISGNTTPGNRINIHGSGFGSEPGSGYVTIADIKAQVVRWSSTEIIVTVPDFSPTGWTFQLAIHQDGKSAEFRLISQQKSTVK
jgi:IPT/TIG domain